MDDNALLIAVLRHLGAAWRALRLYPPSSPMTVQASDSVCAAIEEYLQAEPSLRFEVERGGFIMRGIDELFTQPGIPDLSEALGSHGIGEVLFVAPPDPEELIALLTALQERPQDLHARGGMNAALNEAGVVSIKTVAVVLSKIETPPEIPEEEADKFLAELAADATRLAVWLRSLLSADDEGVTEGLLILANAAESVEVFGRTLAESFLDLDTGDKDRLFEVSITQEPVFEVLSGMLANLSPVELTAAIRGGVYGQNMVGMSYALTTLPLGERRAEMITEMASALRAADVSEVRIDFLNQLIASRAASEPEQPLIDTDAVYRSMLQASRLEQEHFDSITSLIGAREHLDLAGITTLLYLVDIADDVEAYSRMLLALARSVPHLFELGRPDLAMHILREISSRSESSARPWPELESRYALAFEIAGGPRSMAALLSMFAEDEQAAEHTRDIVSLGGEPVARSLASAAIESEAENAMTLAELVLGRRLPELLAPEAPRASASHAAKLAELFARDGGPWCLQALGQLAIRPEDRVRAETARGVAAVGGQAMRTYMPRFLRDHSESVSLMAVRSLARSSDSGAIEMLAQRLGELEGDKDLGLAREIIGVLAHAPSPAAEAALVQVGERGGFLHKGRHAEMKRLAKEALDARRQRMGG